MPATDSYVVLASAIINTSGIVIILNSLILSICLISIRPQNRRADFFYLGLIQMLFECITGIWLIVTKPLFVYSDIGFIIGILVIAVFTVMLFLRLYFINVVRSMFSK